MEKRKDFILNIWFAFIVFYVCFRQFFTEDMFFYLIMDILFLFIIIKGLYEDIRVKWNICLCLYAVLVFDMFFSIFYTVRFYDAVKFTILYLNFIMIAFWFTHSKGWQAVFYRWLKIGCLFHLTYTFFSIIFTEQALHISGYFLTSKAQQATIKWALDHRYAGIAGQTGTNAFFFSVLIGLFSAELASCHKRRFVTKILFVCSWIGLIATKKKGLLIAAVLSVLVLYWITGSHMKKKVIVLLANAGVFFLILFCVVFHEYLYQLFDNSVSTRIKLIEGMLLAIAQKPILGNGVNSIAMFTNEGHLGHNIYLQMWTEQGIIGLIILLLIFAGAFYPTYRNVISDTCKCRNRVSCCFSLYIQLFVMIYGCFGNPIYDYHIFITYLLIIAAGFAGDIKNERKENSKLCSFET